MIPKDNVVVPVVQEFYASLQDQEFGNTEDIDMDNIINFLTEGMGEWKYRLVAPALNVSNVNTFRVVLLYVILQKKQWMQESKPIFQEFARKNNIQVPNHTPDMFRPTHLEQEEEVHDSKVE
ncbi:hypothetical protein Godav_014931 [Gossypium davidsonii]|uniref:Uncharacterized protein n=2 Tax=Gossypium TaxID=3633 RepID=A0A7J8RLS2_GOSDV|nr:hypothetical protein [Gossypium davidsonii]MBA0649889.1 hypothetical protein [Gossypium klotzschianum]